MEELVLRSMSRDDKAFTELIQLIQNDLYRIAQVRLNNIEDINDAIQETMIIAYKQMHKLKNPKYFKTWIIKILINECNKIYKNRLRQFNIFERMVKLNDCTEDSTTELLNIENKMELDNILKILNYEECLCITLFYNSNYSINEIAEILESRPNTIKSRITRAKQKIKKQYKGGAINEISKK